MVKYWICIFLLCGCCFFKQKKVAQAPRRPSILSQELATKLPVRSAIKTVRHATVRNRIEADLLAMGIKILDEQAKKEEDKLRNVV